MEYNAKRPFLRYRRPNFRCFVAFYVYRLRHEAFVYLSSTGFLFHSIFQFYLIELANLFERSLKLDAIEANQLKQWMPLRSTSYSYTQLKLNIQSKQRMYITHQVN